jgi:hypothetical protein
MKLVTFAVPGPRPDSLRDFSIAAAAGVAR